MKIKDIVLKETETDFGKIAAVTGDKITIDKPNGSKVDVPASAVMPNPDKPGAATIDPAASGDQLKPGTTVSANTTAEEQDSPDLIANGNTDVGGDGTDQFINDVRDAEFEKARGYEQAEEGFLGFGNKSPEEWAKTSPQMAKLLQFRAKAKGTPYEAQVEQRIKLLKDRLDMDQGEVAGPGGMPKDPVEPEKFDMKQLREADDALLKQMRMIAGLK